MSVLVRIQNRKAILRFGEWRCADLEFEQTLNQATESWIQETGGPPLSDPDHEHAVAREISVRFGGRILRRLAPVSKESRSIYVERRQMRFSFSPEPRGRKTT
jgi:hypothetical protein